ncbi:MAG: DsbA family protein [Planctomycetota bacterium]|jgi:putative protein-disulfide isomerase
MPLSATLLYIADPMCSWCWGFAPQLRQIEQAFPELKVQIVLGGLAPDTEEPMPEEMRRYVQQAWDAVEQRAGVSFDRSFWDGHVPDIRRSTYPACRAVVLARRAGMEREMFDAIQQAYYMEARNPSDDEVLVGLALDLGMDAEAFRRDLGSSNTQAELDGDLNLRRSLDMHTFPSLALQGTVVPGGNLVLLRGYATAEELLPRLRAVLA